MTQMVKTRVVFFALQFGFFKRKRHDKDEETEEEMTPMKTATTQA